MARKVNCCCGRSFYIGHKSDGIQCRNCGRWWSGKEMGVVETVVHVALGGEIAGCKKSRSKKRKSGARSHKGRQTKRRPKNRSAVGSVIKFFLS